MVRGARDSIRCNGISRGRRSYQAYRHTFTTRNRSECFEADSRGSLSNASTGDSSSGSQACGIIATNNSFGNVT